MQNIFRKIGIESHLTIIKIVLQKKLKNSICKLSHTYSNTHTLVIALTSTCLMECIMVFSCPKKTYIQYLPYTTISIFVSKYKYMHANSANRVKFYLCKGFDSHFLSPECIQSYGIDAN